ncbi:MAG: hypothetical protein MJY70_04940 [Bacteroidales bacterium]|nr:hypothetical protein [Bacteroidales bacterium]
MKKQLINTAIISVLCLAGCKSEQPAQVIGNYNYTFEVLSTKALIGENSLVWEEGDKIGTYAGGLNNNEGEITIGTPCTFNVKTTAPLSIGDKVYAYYPYSASAGEDAKAVVMTVPAVQTILASGFDADAMPVVAVPYTVTGNLEAGTTQPVAGMHFNNLGSIIEFHVYDSAARELKINSIGFNASENICGTYTVDVTAEEAALTASSCTKSVKTTFATAAALPATQAEAVICNMVVAPVTASGVLVINTDKGVFVKNISEKTYARNGVKPLALDVDGMTAVTVDFGVTGVQSFNKSAQQDYTVTVAEVVTDLAVESAPEGWTATLSGNTLTVKAPADDKTALKGKVVLSAMGGAVKGELSVRLYGINDADELAAFTTAYGNSTNTPVTSGDTIAPYLVGGEIALNADITIPSEALVYGAYWLKRLYIPLNGNNHTLTIATKQAERGGLFQNLGANVRDLKIAGTMECTGGAGKYIRMGSLAGYLSADGVTISNVTSTVDIKANNNTNGETMYIGGIIGLYDAAISKPVTVRFENCQFNGTITTTKSVESLGGILGQAQQGSETYITNCSSSAVITCTARGIKGVGGIVGSGGVTTNPGEIVYLTGCSYTGTINYASDGNYDTRIGGILGNLERGAELTGCSFTGTINADMKGKAYLAGSTTRGIGGMIGRDTAPNSGYPKMNAKAILTDCVSNGRISITNSGDSESDNKSHVGQIIGLQKNKTASHVETNCTATTVISVNGVVRQ